MGRIKVEQSILNQIKSKIGYPILEVLDYGDQTDDYIIDNVITRVLRVYFTYFPIKVDTNTAVSGNFEISYPEEDVYKMLRQFFNYKQVNYANFSPFHLQSMIISRGPAFRGYEHGHLSEAMIRMSTEESISDFPRAFRIDDYPRQRLVKGYSSISGDVTIEWAKKSEDFADILYNQLDNAIKLASAYFIQDIYRLRESAKIQTKLEINTAALKEDATVWEQEVITSWTRRGFAVVIK